MEYNTSPISLREAKVMLDGLVVADAVKATIKFTPDVWTGKQLGERTASGTCLDEVLAVEADHVVQDLALAVEAAEVEVAGQDAPDHGHDIGAILRVAEFPAEQV